SDILSSSNSSRPSAPTPNLRSQRPATSLVSFLGKVSLRLSMTTKSFPVPWYLWNFSFICLQRNKYRGFHGDFFPVKTALNNQGLEINSFKFVKSLKAKCKLKPVI